MRKPAALAFLVTIFLAVSSVLAQGRAAPLVIEQGIRRVTVQAEIAETPRERELGLMHRQSLPEDAGMLFIYPEASKLSFWMMNTRVPLSIAFISEKGVITEILDMNPPAPGVEPPVYTSREASRYALEMNQGWFEKKGIGLGARVRVEALGR